MSDPAGLKLPLYIEGPQLHRYVFDANHLPLVVVMGARREDAQHRAEVIVAALTADAEKGEQNEEAET